MGFSLVTKHVHNYFIFFVSLDRSDFHRSETPGVFQDWEQQEMHFCQLNHQIACHSQPKQNRRGAFLSERCELPINLG